MWHIWTIDDWEKNIDLNRAGHQSGLRLKIDKDVNIEVRRACKDFAKFLRKNYYFPLRIDVYVKSQRRIKAMDGDLCCGIFWSMEDDFTVKPSIRIATGDYEELLDKWDQDRALTSILLTLAHELTHYFQWINSLNLTPIGAERQATNYSHYIIEEYAETRDHP